MLDATSDNVPSFITKKWVEVHDQSGSTQDRYKPSKQIRFKASMLRSYLCDFSEAYIAVKGKVTAIFNPRKDDYDNNDFPDNLFPDRAFPEERTAEEITSARNAARINAVNTANDAANDKRNLIKGSSFTKYSPFTNCISKINDVQIVNAKDLDVVMPK